MRRKIKIKTLRSLLPPNLRRVERKEVLQRQRRMKMKKTNPRVGTTPLPYPVVKENLWTRIF